MFSLRASNDLSFFPTPQQTFQHLVNGTTTLTSSITRHPMFLPQQVHWPIWPSITSYVKSWCCSQLVMVGGRLCAHKSVSGPNLLYLWQGLNLHMWQSNSVENGGYRLCVDKPERVGENHFPLGGPVQQHFGIICLGCVMHRSVGSQGLMK